MKAYVLIENNEVGRVKESINLRIKYEFDKMKTHGKLGNGLYAYLDLEDHIDYLIFETEWRECKILELNLFDLNYIDTLTDEGQGRLRGIWDYEGGFKNDREFLKYLSGKVAGLVGIHVEGDSLHKNPALTSMFIGRVICIYDTSMIKSYRFI